MDSLCIQDMVRSQQESSGQELEKAFILPMAFPQKNRRLCLGEVLEVLPEVLLGEQVVLERGLVCRPCSHQVPHQRNRCGLRLGLVFRKELGCQPGCSEGVVIQEVQVCSRLV